MTDLTETEIIFQQNARIKELESAIDELARNAFNVVKYMNSKESKWTAITVKSRLEELLFELRAGKTPNISEQEIRELQHWFNETSAPFLRNAWKELKRTEAKKRQRMKI